MNAGEHEIRENLEAECQAKKYFLRTNPALNNDSGNDRIVNKDIGIDLFLEKSEIIARQ